MINVTTGNIFDANADALVNTVNCEGYMGKGIAYQFKVRFPQNNDRYKEACKKGEFKIGSILTTKESDKLIINFPTKDKWRKKSEYEFIESGMQQLISLLPQLQINSIAFPPLGCGNGGLDWGVVKDILINYLKEFEGDYNIILYAPSKVINKAKVEKAPKLNSSHLLLMMMKEDLSKFNKLRLQKTSYLLNYYAQEEYFKFQAYNFGPFANSISILSRQIKEFQTYYQLKTDKAIELAFKTIISKTVKNKIKKYESPLIRAAGFVNKVNSDKELELLTTLLYIIERNYPIEKNDLTSKLAEWSDYKAKTFSKKEVESATNYLLNKGLLLNTIDGLEPNLKKN